MRGLQFSLSQEGVTETPLENQMHKHITVCCDVCSPFSETLKRSVQDCARKWIKEALAESESTLSENVIQSTLQKVNERLRNHFKRDRKRVALAIVVFIENHEDQTLTIASTGDLLALKAQDSGFEIIHQTKDASKYENERERLKDLSDAFIRSHAPKIQLSTESLDAAKGMAAMPQALYHRLSAEEVQGLLHNPTSTESGLDKLLEKNQIVLSNLEIVILTEASTHMTAEPPEPPTQEAPNNVEEKLETHGVLPGQKKEPAKQATVNTKLFIGAAAAVFVIAGGFTFYKTVKANAKKIEIATVEHEVDGTLAQRDLTSSEKAKQELLEEAKKTSNELHRQLEAQRTKIQSQQAIISQLEKSLKEENQKSHFLRESLVKEVEMREAAQDAYSQALAENTTLEDKFTQAEEARKATKILNLNQLAGRNPYIVTPEEPLTPFPSKKWKALQEEKSSLEKKYSELANKHDNLFAENEMLREQIQVFNTQGFDTNSLESAKQLSEERFTKIAELEASNYSLKKQLETVSTTQKKAYEELAYMKEAYEGLETELKRQRERNTLLLSELEGQKRAWHIAQRDMQKPKPTPRNAAPSPTKLATTARSAQQTSVAQEQARQTQITHIVQKGETLSEIASLYFGSSKDWKKIYEANRDQIPASNLIKVGMELAIPAQQ